MNLQELLRIIEDIEDHKDPWDMSHHYIDYRSDFGLAILDYLYVREVSDFVKHNNYSNCVHINFDDLINDKSLEKYINNSRIEFVNLVVTEENLNRVEELFAKYENLVYDNPLVSHSLTLEQIENIKCKNLFMLFEERFDLPYKFIDFMSEEPDDREIKINVGFLRRLLKVHAKSARK